MLATEVTAGTPENTVVTPVPDAVALFDSVSVDVPAPETTVVPDGKFALEMPDVSTADQAAGVHDVGRERARRQA